MANILDIFQTQTGEKLLTRSSEITKLEPKVLENAFIFMFPALLSHFKNNAEAEIYKETGDLVDLIENRDILSFGKEKSVSLFTDLQEEIFLEFAPILNTEESKFQKVFFIAVAVLTVIISEMNKTNKRNLPEILNTLSGLNTKYNKDYIQVLIKNPEDPNFINTSEEITLGTNKDDDDPSILGGYTGGR